MRFTNAQTNLNRPHQSILLGVRNRANKLLGMPKSSFWADTQTKPCKKSAQSNYKTNFGNILKLKCQYCLKPQNFGSK